MKSLKDFFEINLENQYYKELYNSRFANNNYEQLEILINTHFVIKNNVKINAPKVKFGLNHDTIINHCIAHLIENNLLNNLLTFGYRLGEGKDVNEMLYCTMVNSNVNIIRSFLWQQLHHVVGTTYFIMLLINCTVLQINSGFNIDSKAMNPLFSRQIIGNKSNLPHLPPIWLRKKLNKYFEEQKTISKRVLRCRVSNKACMYKSRNFQQQFIPLKRSLNLKQLSNEMYGLNNMDISKNIRKKINGLVSNLIRNCKKKIDYSKILETFCPSEKNFAFEKHLSLASEKKGIIRFTTIIIEKLLPFETYGSKKNKSAIFKCIAKVLNLPYNGSIPLSELAKNFKIKHLRFFLNNTKHIDRDLAEKLNIMYLKFLLWLLEVLVPDIVSSFFYCSEISGRNDIIFFKHSIWNKISYPFIKRYFEESLIENAKCRNHDSYVLSDYNHCRMRLIPKSAPCEFRLITIPCKGVDSEELLAFRINQIKNIVPIQSILKYLRMKNKTHFTKLSSVSCISGAIAVFKEKLLKKFGTLPNLYYMKFDIENCYDSIPRNKALELLKRLLRKEDDFYVRSYTYFDSNRSSLKVLKLVNEIKKPNNSDIFIDDVRTYHFTPADILHAVETEFFKTALYVKEKCFLRKDGLFQGSSFSSLIVDLMYDDLLSYYKEFKCEEDEDNLLLRIADDFLVISTSKIQIDNISQLALSGFEQYNARVKREKICLTNSQSSNEVLFKFCALSINVKKLEILKESSAFNKPMLSLTSLLLTYRRLLSILETRLMYKTLSSNVNSLETILEQIRHISLNIAQISLIAFEGKNISKDSFTKFIENVIESIFSHTNQEELSKDDFFFLVKSIVIETFHKIFRIYQNKHKSIFEVLKTLIAYVLKTREAMTKYYIT